MGQDPRANHDSALNEPVGDPGRDAEGERGQGVDEGGTVKDGGDGNQILDNVHDRLGGVTDEEVGRDSVSDLLDGEVHRDVVSLELLLGLDLVLDYDTATHLVVNNMRGCHCCCFLLPWLVWGEVYGKKEQVELKRMEVRKVEGEV